VEAAMEMLRSPAYSALNQSGRRVLGIIENELSKGGDGVAISLSEMVARTGLCRTSARYGIRQVERLGFVVILVAERRTHWFAMSDGWKSLDADEAGRLMALADQRPVRRVRIGTKPVEPPKPVRVPKPVEPPMQRRVPSLPRLPWDAGDSR
jgi:hypothetical protein